MWDKLKTELAILDLWLCGGGLVLLFFVAAAFLWAFYRHSEPPSGFWPE